MRGAYNESLVIGASIHYPSLSSDQGGCVVRCIMDAAQNTRQGLRGYFKNSYLFHFKSDGLSIYMVGKF